MKKLLMASILASLSLIGASASAQSTGNFQSTAKLEAKCFISAQNMSFGQINIIGYVGFATGAIEVLCSKDVNYNVRPIGGYDLSTNINSVHLLRGTAGNTDALKIVLYKENEINTWNGNPDRHFTGPGTGAIQTHVIKARLQGSDTTSGTDGSITNARNDQVKPDIYTGTVTTLITY